MELSKRMKKVNGTLCMQDYERDRQRHSRGTDLRGKTKNGIYHHL